MGADRSARSSKVNNRHLLLLLLASCLPAAAFAQSAPAVDAKLHQLDVSAGRWVYHGQFLGTKGSPPSAWVWREDCRWSANRLFMLCTFSNTWGGRPVDSVVIDTYDSKRDTFWHYEVFDSGDSAGKPFAARMRIDGNTRIEYWTHTHHGKAVRQRIVYRFVSDDRVTVKFQQSTDRVPWETVATGTGRKIGA
jgi:hypothetical protein